MGKSNAAVANVIDLEAFRQKKMREERAPEESAAAAPNAAMFVPVWFCWVPVWAPMS